MPMKTIEGYSKEKYTDTSVLLAGGGAKALSSFIGSLTWDSTNKKIQYTPVGGSATDLVTLSWDNISGKPSSFTPSTHSHTDISQKWTAYAGKEYIGWVKIIEWTLNTSNQMNALAFQLHMYRSYNSPSPESYSFDIKSSWGNSPINIQQLNGSTGSQIINKLRFIRDDTNHKLYLEYYVNTNYSTYRNTVTIQVFGFGTGTPITNGLVQTEAETDIVVVKEFTINATGASISGTISNATSATAADTVKVASRSTDASHYLAFVGSNNSTAAAESLYTDGGLVYNPSTNRLIITSSSGQQQEVTVSRTGGSSISVMVGTANANHGLYSNTASKWIVYSDASGNVTLNGNATTATTASKLGTADVGSASRPIYLAAGVPTQTTYKMAGTNVTATTALAISTNLDTGIWYVNGTNSTDLYSVADGAAYVNKYSDSWIAEIYQDYRTGQIALRGKNNGTWQAWRKVLDSSNFNTWAPKLDGTGATGTWGINISGDADTVDSYHASNLAKQYSYELGPKKCVKITYTTNAPVIISAGRSNSGGQFMLVGLGYGTDGWTRNQFRCLIPSSMFTWRLAGTTTVEVYHTQSSGNAAINVITTGSITFAEASALSGDADVKRFACYDELTWENISGKPTSFTPAAHTHYIGTTSTSDTSAAGKDLTGIGTVYITGTAGTYREGIRIKPYNNWSTIVLGGTDLSADSGTSTKSWSIHNNDGNFYITKNGSSSSSSAILSNVSNNWTFGKGNVTVSEVFTASSTVKFKGLDAGTSDVSDDTEILTSYAGTDGFANTTGDGKVYRRTAPKLYNYIKTKLSTAGSGLDADLLDGAHKYELRAYPRNNSHILFSTLPYLLNGTSILGAGTPVTSMENAPEGLCWGPITSSKSFYSDYIEVEPGEVLYGEIWAYRASGATGTAGTLYYGIDRYDRNKKAIASNAGCTYFVTSGSTVAADGVWHKYTGTTTIPTSHTAYSGSDGKGVYYVKIRVLVNYSSGTIPTYIGRILLSRKVWSAKSADSVAWDNITGKPSTFTPSSHEHSAADITSGTLGVARGGTGLSTIAIYSILYASAANTLSALGPNKANSNKFLRMKGTGSAGAAPTWAAVDWADLSGKPSTFTAAAHEHAAGDITSGTLAVARGGTNKSSWTKYGVIYASDTTTLAQTSLPTWAASTTYWLKCVTNASKVPTYSLSTLSKSDIGLGNVENTALSTWAGSTNITTLGTIATGTWSATTIAVNKGGTGKTSWTKYGIVYASDTTTLAQTSLPTWAASTTYVVKAVTNASKVPSFSIGTIGWSEITGKPNSFTPASHNHAAGDITSGTLGVARGGTGKASWTQYGLVYASATTTLAQVSQTWAASKTYWLKAVTNASKVPTYSFVDSLTSDKVTITYDSTGTDYKYVTFTDGQYGEQILKAHYNLEYIPAIGSLQPYLLNGYRTAGYGVYLCRYYKSGGSSTGYVNVGPTGAGIVNGASASGNFSGTDTKVEDGKHTITLTNGTKSYWCVWPVLQVHYNITGSQDDCMEFGWANFYDSSSTGVKNVSPGGTVSFTFCCGRIHCQGSWAARDYVRLTDTPGITITFFGSQAY